MPTHGRTGLERLASGASPSRCSRRAPCAVVAVPSYGRIPVSADVPRPAGRSSLALEQALGDALANHDV